jgi:phospholipid transport system substrate-binding protein
MTRLATLALGLALLAPASAAASPAAALQGLAARVNAVLAGPAAAADPRERLDRVLAILDERVAFREAAALALGPGWPALRPAQQEEFVGLFRGVLGRALLGSLAGRARVRDGVQIRTLGEVPDGDGVRVATAMPGRAGDDVLVDYRMVHRDDGWAIRDVVVDGVSVTDNLRAQVTRVVRDGSYAMLLARLRERAPASAPAAAVAAATPSARAAAATAPPADAPVLKGQSRVAMVPAPASLPAVPLTGTRRPADRPPAPPPPLGAAPVRPVVATAPAVPAVPAVAPAPPASGPADALHPSRLAALAAPTAAAATPYWVQVGAFTSADAAWRLAAALLAQDLPVRVVPGHAMPPGAALSRVQVGPFADRADASATLRALAARGHRAFVTPSR